MQLFLRLRYVYQKGNKEYINHKERRYALNKAIITGDESDTTKTTNTAKRAKNIEEINFDENEADVYYDDVTKRSMFNIASRACTSASVSNSNNLPVARGLTQHGSSAFTASSNVAVQAPVLAVARPAISLQPDSLHASAQCSPYRAAFQSLSSQAAVSSHASAQASYGQTASQSLSSPTEVQPVPMQAAVTNMHRQNRHLSLVKVILSHPQTSSNFSTNSK